jgi:hypothetical protein
MRKVGFGSPNVQSSEIIPFASKVRFRGEANMNWQARLVGSVENDP